MPISQLENISRDFEESVGLSHSHKTKAAKTLLNNAGIVIGVFISFAVIVVVTTDIRLASWADVSKLGVDFFLLLFCSYSMYITCSDSGMRFGLRNEDYLLAVNKFDEHKKYIIDNKLQCRLHEFCRYYKSKELENTKMNILAVVGFDYETYLRNWLALTDEQIYDLQNLTDPQKAAIVKANKVMPIDLTPEMIMKRGRRSAKRAPLGIDPETKKKINFGVKFVTTVLTTLSLTAIVIEFVIEPTWIMFASIILRLLIVILNGFSGYKFGYENIVFDTSNYLRDQTDLMAQALQYFEENNKDENGIQIKVI